MHMCMVYIKVHALISLKFTSSDPKKVAFVFFATESLSNPGKGMIITKIISKMRGKIGLNIIPDFEAS